ncbi:restriction endonuclease subunit S [Coprobacillus sp. AF13-4LB]|nr:restriction endonuclease subunit S [Coprobacillus sp. AF13-4LB]
MRVKIEDVCMKGSSNLKQSDVVGKNGIYPVYGAAGYLGSIDSFKQSKPYVAVVKDGAGIGRAMLLPSNSSIIGTMQYLLPKDNILPEYLYYLIKAKHLEKYYSGATIPHIYFKDYKNEEFDLFSFEIQYQIINKLKIIEKIIEKQKKEMDLLDELVKARFVELFGDPIINDKGLITELLANVSNLKAGKAIKTGELSENNDTNSLFPCFGGNGIRGYINRYTHDGTFPIIGRQGALSGNVNFAKGKFYATEHAIVVTPKVELDDTWFFYCLKYLDLKRFQTGAAQPGVSVEKLNNISIPLPNYKSQLYFSDFVKEVDKSRLEVQKSLKKTQELFDSLMQKYFG